MSRYVSPTFQIDDINGFSQVGAKLVFYTPGTTNLKTIYSDSGFTTPITNPVTSVSSNAGAIYPNIYLDGLYDVVQQDATGTVDTDDGATIWTRDDVGETSTGPFTLWDTGVIYAIPEIVLGSDDEYYRSLIDSNQGNNPISSPASWEQLRFGRIWNTNITYAIGDSVYGSDGHLYIARVSQSGNDPVGDTTNWDESITANSPTILSPTILTPVIAQINDANGNESVIYTPTTDAVNELTHANAATGNDPTTTASGDDADVGENHVMKGDGLFQIGSKRLNHPGVGYGGRVLIETATASASASIEFTTGIDSAYKIYEIEMINAIPSTADDTLIFAVSLDAGSTWETGAGEYRLGTTDGTAAWISSTTAATVESTAANGGLCGTLTIYDPSNASVYTFIRNNSSYWDNSGNLVVGNPLSVYKTVTAVDGFKIYFAAQTIASGEFRLFGVIV